MSTKKKREEAHRQGSSAQFPPEYNSAPQTLLLPRQSIARLHPIRLIILDT